MEKTEFYDKVTERLIRYAKIDTQSSNESRTVPTTGRQYDLARVLKTELTEIGVSDVCLDEDACVLYGKVPANLGTSDGKGCPVLGLVVHMDTAPDAPGSGVRPWVLQDYDGGDIVLNRERNIVMRAETFPNLQSYRGQDLVLTDGTTLLGGDDKAGIAAVVTFAEHLIRHPEIRHGEISLAFTPDEEVGGLAQNLDLERFGAKTAYTLDGDHLGWYMDETFNASAATVDIRGFSVHTATARGKMINAAEIAAWLISQIPMEERPQTTEGREGFYHVTDLAGDCEHAQVRLILRDFDRDGLKRREEFLRKLALQVDEYFGQDTVSVKIEQQYRSMKEAVDKVPWTIDALKGAIQDCGITPHTEPFRGGTDGSALSERGLPSPNLSAGYENAHGRFEFVPIRSMEKNVQILLKLAERYKALPV